MAKSKRNAPRSMGGGEKKSAMTLEEFSAHGFGDLASALDATESQYMRAAPVSIFEILPSPTQPRRAMPGPVRAHWNGDSGSVAALFGVWEDAVRAERDDPAFEITAFFLADEDTPETEMEPGPVEAALRGIIDIALSVRANGLTNPITVARVGSNYRIETGERRWLAYHLLHALDGEGGWGTIPARTVDEVDVWRQAAENGARDDLNAIGKARQIAVLLMDQHRQHNDMHFQPYEHFQHDRDYYAQILGTKAERALRGTQDDILAVVGLKHGRQVSQYRALLKLPAEAWNLADDHNLTEYALRGVLTDVGEDDPAGLEQSVHALVFGTPPPSRNGTVVPLSRETPPEPGVGSRRYYVDTERIFRKIGPGRKNANAAARQRLEELRRHLDAVEEQLAAYES